MDQRTQTSKSLLISGALILGMLATRSDHFGSAISLPDASLAVFFMAGLYFRKLWLFLGLCTLAAASDYWAIEHRGVSSFCVTAAYGFLLPTYYVMWWAGQRAATLPLSGWQSGLTLLALTVVATSAAFFISSGSFYLLAPYFSSTSIAEFAQRTAAYYPRYTGYTLGYLVLGLAVYFGLNGFAQQENKRHA